MVLPLRLFAFYTLSRGGPFIFLLCHLETNKKKTAIMQIREKDGKRNKFRRINVQNKLVRDL